MSVKGLPPYSTHYLTSDETISFFNDRKDKAEVYSLSDQTLKEDVQVRFPSVTDIPPDITPKQMIRWILKQGYIPYFTSNQVAFYPPSPNFNFFTTCPNEENTNVVAASNQILAVGSVKGCIKLWDLTTPKPVLKHKEEHGICISALATFGQLVACGSVDGLIKIWKAPSFHELRDPTTGLTPVTALIFLDSNWLISGYKDGKIKFWDLKSGKCTHTQDFQKNSVTTFRVSPNKKMLVSGSSNNHVFIWKIETSRITYEDTLKDHEGSINAREILPNGTVVIAYSDKTLNIWNPSTKEYLCTFETELEVVDLFLLDANFLAIKLKNNEIRTCNVSKLDPNQLDKLSQMRISIQGSAKLTLTDCSRLITLDDQDGFSFMQDRILGSWSSRTKRINLWKFSPSAPKKVEKEEVLATCSQSTQELEAEFTKIREAEGKQGLSNYLLSWITRSESPFSRKERVQKGVESLKEFEKQLQANNIKAAKESIQRAVNLTSSTPAIQKVRRVYIAFIRFQGKMAQASFLYPDIKLLLEERAEKNKLIAQLNQEKNAVTAKNDQLSKENEKIRKEQKEAISQKQLEIEKLQTDYEKKLKLLTAISQIQLIKTLSGHTEEVNAFGILSDKLMGESTTGKGLVWNLTTWEKESLKEGPSSGVFLNSFLQLIKGDSNLSTFAIPPMTTFSVPSSLQLLAFYSNGNSIQIVSTIDGTLKHEFTKCPARATSMSFQDQYFAASFSDGTLMLWDLKTSKSILSLKNLGDIKALALLSNGFLAYGLKDNPHIHLTSIDGKGLKQLTGHSGPIQALIAYTDEYLISGSKDGAIKFWDISRNICIRTLKGHKSVLALALLTDQTLISSHSDATINVWNHISKT